MQLLYLGLCIRDFRSTFGHTKVFDSLQSDERYRGALFEIEAGAELSRCELKPIYRTTSPDFICRSIGLGVEASIREVPLHRAVTEQLFAMLSGYEFKRLLVELTVKGEHDIDELMVCVISDVQQLLSNNLLELCRPRYRLGHDVFSSLERTVEISFGEYRYEETLPHLIKNSLKQKEESIANGLRGGPAMQCVVAIDARSVLDAVISPKSEYERRVIERNRPHFDRQRVVREQVEIACQAFVRGSELVKGVLLWGRRRHDSPAEELHRRYSKVLVTSELIREVDTSDLGTELAKIANGNLPS